MLFRSHERKRNEYSASGTAYIPDTVRYKLQLGICILPAGIAADTGLLHHLPEADPERRGKRSGKIIKSVCNRQGEATPIKAAAHTARRTFYKSALSVFWEPGANVGGGYKFFGKMWKSDCAAVSDALYLFAVILQQTLNLIYAVSGAL